MMESLGRQLDLSGLTFASAQVWGTVRLFPILAESPIEDLHLHRQVIDACVSVTLRGEHESPREVYCSYVPHAFVASVGDDGAVAAYGTKLAKSTAKPKRDGWMQLHRMARIEDGNLRFLPLHMAMEGYLDLHFGGPDVAWEEYSNYALAVGLSPRYESYITGKWVPGLDDALRVFEIHERQVGIALFIGDVFTSVFVVPNPADYRVLHPTLLTDLLGDTICWNAMGYPEVPEWDLDLKPDGPIESLADIRAALETREAEWATFHESLTVGLFDAPIHLKSVRSLGRFTLQAFRPTFRLEEPNHIGEMITDERGRIAYMKTMLMTQAQVRRGHLLSLLHAAEWNLERAAADNGDTRANLVNRIIKSGFGYLLKPNIWEILGRGRK